MQTTFTKFFLFSLFALQQTFAQATDEPLFIKVTPSLKPLRITMTEGLNKTSEVFLGDVEQAYPYAQLTDAGYKFAIENIPGYRRLEKDELPSEWQSYFVAKKEDTKYPLGKGMLINDKKNNMWATVLESDKEIVLVLRGTELRPSFFSDMAGNFMTAIKHWWGSGIPQHFMRSFQLAKALKDKYPNKELVITGSSLGGSLAMFAGLATDARVYAFNSLGLNANEISFIKAENKDAFSHADRKVSIINVVGDAIVDNSSVLPNWFLNKYFGKLIMVPFYDNSWSGYYLSVHHTSDALVKSMEAYIKRSHLANGQLTITTAQTPDMKTVTASLEADEVRIINQTNAPVRFVAFTCTHSPGSNYCDESIFAYPHKEFSMTESPIKAHSSLPFMSVALSKKPVTIREMSDKITETTLRLQAPEKLSWPNDYFVKNRWVYVTAMNPSENCRIGTNDSYSYLGTPSYVGTWPSSWISGTSTGWLSGDGKNNPKALVITKGSDECSFTITGF